MGRRFKGAQLRNDPRNIGQYVISIAEPKAENTVASMLGISVSHTVVLPCEPPILPHHLVFSWMKGPVFLELSINCFNKSSEGRQSQGP